MAEDDMVSFHYSYCVAGGVEHEGCGSPQRRGAAEESVQKTGGEKPARPRVGAESQRHRGRGGSGGDSGRSITAWRGTFFPARRRIPEALGGPRSAKIGRAHV